MTNDLRASLRAEAVQFADRVHDLMISQLTSILGGAGVKPAAQVPAATRRESLKEEAIEEALAQVIKLLEKHPSGLRSERIRSELNMSKKLFQYAAHLGKTSDQLTQTGERRLTVYSLPARPSKAQEEGRVIKRSETSTRARKPARK